MKKLFNWGINFIRTMDWGEVLRYLIIGLCTTGINYIVYKLFLNKLHLQVNIADLIAWVVSTLFAFFANSFFVFKVKPKNAGEFFRFLAGFFGERLFTLGVEELILFVFVTLMKFNDTPVKIIAMLIVIALNYFISKLLVFRKRKPAESVEAEND